ncbi:MAG TPA: hypothetical protein VE732_08655, partial [Nitrososphaera sp.]|nr:hypothetical protein [Nitrososphaera sp.]
MSHSVDIDGIHESIFLLQNLGFASRSFCKAHHIHRDSETREDFGWDYYRGWLKSLVCDLLIQCATKTRIIQDMLKD